MTHFCYLLAYLCALVAIVCLWKSQAGVRAELHADDWNSEGNSR